MWLLDCCQIIETNLPLSFLFDLHDYFVHTLMFIYNTCNKKDKKNII